MSKPNEKPGPVKIAVAALSIAGALATVAYHGGLIDFGGEAQALTEEPDGPRPIPLDAAPEPSPGAGPIAADGESTGSSDEPVARALEDLGAPDWRGMFDALMAREDQRRAESAAPVASAIDEEAAEVEAERRRAEEAARAATEAQRRAAEATAGLSGLALRGTLSVDGQGVALLDGRLLRVGDVVPGTSAQVVAVWRDRIALRHPDLAGEVELHLAPFERPGADEADGASSVSGDPATDDAAPTEPEAPTPDDG